MQNADREKHSSCKQEAPQTFGKACEHMIDPCEEADYANKESHYVSLFGGGTNRSSASMLHGVPPVDQILPLMLFLLDCFHLFVTCNTQ